jgi:hypothetical protein
MSIQYLMSYLFKEEKKTFKENTNTCQHCKMEILKDIYMAYNYQFCSKLCRNQYLFKIYKKKINMYDDNIININDGMIH